MAVLAAHRAVPALAQAVARRAQRVPHPQALRRWLLPRAHLPVPVVAALSVPVPVVPAEPPVLVDQEVAPEVPLRHLRSRQSF